MANSQQPKSRTTGPPKPELVTRDTPPKREGHEWRPWICPEVDLSATAVNLGISSSHLSYIVNGSRRPSLRVAQRIAAMLDSNMDEIGRAVDRGDIWKIFNRVARERRKQAKQQRAQRGRERRQSAEPDENDGRRAALAIA